MKLQSCIWGLTTINVAENTVDGMEEKLKCLLEQWINEQSGHSAYFKSWPHHRLRCDPWACWVNGWPPLCAHLPLSGKNSCIYLTTRFPKFKWNYIRALSPVSDTSKHLIVSYHYHHHWLLFLFLIIRKVLNCKIRGFLSDVLTSVFFYEQRTPVLYIKQRWPMASHCQDGYLDCLHHSL